jgi:hypothetical protein
MTPSRDRGRSSRLRFLILMATGALVLALCPDARAATTFGSSLSAAPEKSNCGTSTFTNTALPTGLAAPFAGAIVRWRMDLQEPGGANLYKLRILRPAGGSNYTAVGTGPGQTAAFAGIDTLTLPTPLPVQAGDIIAIDCPNGAPIPSTDHGLTGSKYAFFNPVLGEGKTASPTNQLPGDEVLINADVVGLPSVASISPASGPAGGGAVVSLTGSHLGEVSAVSFGGIPASFTLVSESQLFAVVPPGAGGTEVDVSIANAAGSAAAPQAFAYLGGVTEAPAGPTPTDSAPAAASADGGGGGGGGSLGGAPSCVVPELVGKSLKAARKRLAKADCKLGKVAKKGAVGPDVKVVKQKPKAGMTRPPGSKINVALGGK